MTVLSTDNVIKAGRNSVYAVAKEVLNRTYVTDKVLCYQATAVYNVLLNFLQNSQFWSLKEKKLED